MDANFNIDTTTENQNHNGKNIESKEKIWIQAVRDNELISIIYLQAIRDDKQIIVDFEFQFINKKAEESLNRANLIGKRLVEEFPGSKTTGLINQYIQVVNTGIPWEDEIYYNEDGFESWLLVKATKLDDGCLIFYSDVKERKKSELELKKSKDLIEHITSVTPDLILIHEVGTMRIIYSNRNWLWHDLVRDEDFFVMEPQKKVELLFHPDDRIKAANYHYKVWELPEEEMLEVELRNYKGNSSWGWIRIQSKVFARDASGKACEIISFVTDITEKKNAEEELEERKHFIQQVTDNIPDVVYVYDLLNRKVLYVNREVYTTLGYLPEDIYEMGSQVPRLMLHPDDYPVRETHISNLRTIQPGEVREVEFRVRDIKDQWHWYRSRHTFFKASEDGTAWQVLGISQNINESKLAIEALVEKQRLGAIGEMATSLAHDFNNSLQSILGNLELATHGSKFLPDDTFRYLKNMRTVITHAITTVHQLQRFGGKAPERRQYGLVNINSLVEEGIAQSRPLWKDEAEARGLSINVRTELGEAPDICGNEAELRTVLFNIIKNSIEAMPNGGDIFIKTGKKKEGIFISITDTGTGMDEETKARIFQPFFSTKGFNLGRGLGMSGALSIVKEHQGNIYVKNTSRERGTTVEILLPVYEKETPAAVKGVEVKKPDVKNAKDIVKILWVDDDESIREIAGEIIKILGHEADVVESGKEALTYLEKNTYDVVITDIGMPEMNGWQLADKIREKYRGEMKIAFISGWGPQIKDHELKEHGVSYNLSKPFNISQLQKLLEKIKKNEPA